MDNETKAICIEAYELAQRLTNAGHTDIADEILHTMVGICLRYSEIPILPDCMDATRWLQRGMEWWWGNLPQPRYEIQMEQDYA